MGNERTALDNKGILTKQRKPSASTKCKCEDKDALREICTTAILYYDLVRRQIRTLSSNGAFTPVRFNPWLQKRTFDVDGNATQNSLENSVGKTVPAQPGDNLKIATTAAEITSKTAITSEAAGAPGWLNRLMPWIGRVGGGVPLMLHSGGLNQGEEQYLAHRRPHPGQRWRPDMNRPIPDEPKPQSFGHALANSAFGKLIARGEGNYSSVNRGARGGYKAGTENLGGMTVAEVMAAQEAGRFNAVGRYQIIRGTLKEATKAMRLTGTEKFGQNLQDRIFGEYLVKRKRRKIADYIEGRSDNLRAALRASAREWASVANPDSPEGLSFYAGKGKNKATISATEMEMALRNTRATYAGQLALPDAPIKRVRLKSNKTLN